MTDRKMSFTAGFSFQNGTPVFRGFLLETAISDELKLRYRLLVKKPDDGFLYTMKGMEEPMRVDEIDLVLKQQYQGGIAADEFAFEVFDARGNKLFATKFNARERMPSEAYESDKIVFTSFSWAFELPDSMPERS